MGDPCCERFPIVHYSANSIVAKHPVVEEISEIELQRDVDHIEEIAEIITCTVVEASTQLCHLQSAVLDLLFSFLIDIAS